MLEYQEELRHTSMQCARFTRTKPRKEYCWFMLGDVNNLYRADAELFVAGSDDVVGPECV